jgi:(p)ppGpp synthase/HD superfamily hydrolase
MVRKHLKRHSVSLGPRFERALVFAKQKHDGQTRKKTSVPYISHLLMVAGLVLQAGGDEDLAIAALLHDVVEDCGGMPMLKDVRRQFGKRVAHVVEGCTDSFETPKKPWKERKVYYLRHLRTADRDVRLVSAADKLHNAREILSDFRESGPVVWERFAGKREGTIWYYRALVREFKRRSPNRLVLELDRAVKELVAVTGGVRRK